MLLIYNWQKQLWSWSLDIEMMTLLVDHPECAGTSRAPALAVSTPPSWEAWCPRSEPSPHNLIMSSFFGPCGLINHHVHHRPLMIIVNSLWSILTEIIRCAAPLVHQLNRRPPPTPPTPPQTTRPTRPTPTKRAHAAAAQASSCQELPHLLVDLGLVTLAIGLSVLPQFRSHSNSKPKDCRIFSMKGEKYFMIWFFSILMFSLCQGVIRDVLVKIKAGITRLIKSMKDENFINEVEV